MVLKINGVDFLPYVAFEGFKWQRSDVDGPNAGRSIDSGDLIRDRLAIKYRLDITCRPLTRKEASKVLQAIEPEFVTVTYTDPMAGEEVTRTMYSNNIPASVVITRKDGTELWGGITFPLVQK